VNAVEASSLVLMNRVDGILEKELGSYEIEEGLELVYKAFVENNKVCLFLTIDRDVNDEEYNEVFDNYNMDELSNMGFEVSEVEEYNPVWEVNFEFNDDHDEVEEALNSILSYHNGEVKRIFGEIEE
jgi:hypothetical protein